VREELPGEPRWTYSGTKLETADTAKESLQLPGLLYSEYSFFAAVMHSRIWAKQLFTARRAMSGENSCVRKGLIMVESLMLRRE